jgi:hypothetical protein
MKRNAHFVIQVEAFQQVARGRQPCFDHYAITVTPSPQSKSHEIASLSAPAGLRSEAFRRDQHHVMRPMVRTSTDRGEIALKSFIFTD